MAPPIDFRSFEMQILFLLLRVRLASHVRWRSIGVGNWEVVDIAYHLIPSSSAIQHGTRVCFTSGADDACVSMFADRAQGEERGEGGKGNPFGV